MNISFVNMPRLGFRFGESIEPLGILYLSAALKKAGYEKRTLVDADQSNLTIDDCVQKIIAQSPDLLLCSVLAPTYNYAAELSTKVKSKEPKTTIVWGGIHPSLHYNDILKNIPSVDYIVVGEGERTIVELADAIRLGDVVSGKRKA